jgi:hypothetical protein
MADSAVSVHTKADVEQFLADLERVGKDIEVTALLVGVQQRYQRQLQWYCGGAAFALVFCVFGLALLDAPFVAVIGTLAMIIPFALKAHDPR